MSERVVIVDVGLGNLRSVAKAVETAGADLSIELTRSRDPDVIRRADRLIVPGQGSFGGLVERLDTALVEAILERLRAGTPYFGICLGLQILFESSDEAPGKAGWGWFQGRVKRLEGGVGVKVPHMGWNEVEVTDPGHGLLGHNEWFYFVHSYHAVPLEAGLVQAAAGYGSNRVTAAVGRDHVIATQFHPEKSQAAGLSLLTRFLRR